MPKVLKFKQVVSALNHFGYYEKRQRGSHIIFENSEGKITVVPKHTNGEVMTGTVLKICKDIDIPYNTFKIHT
jgi:predicted RNA binding protein YcfA (HicA-like mRNA interferase family)